MMGQCVCVLGPTTNTEPCQIRFSKRLADLCTNTWCEVVFLSALSVRTYAGTVAEKSRLEGGGLAASKFEGRGKTSE